jgi:hypothetical protein
MRKINFLKQIVVSAAKIGTFIFCLSTISSPLGKARGDHSCCGVPGSIIQRGSNKIISKMSIYGCQNTTISRVITTIGS